MFSETILKHFGTIYDSKIESLIEPAIEVQSSDKISSVINEISNNDVYDVYCMERNSVLTTNIRTMLEAKDISDMPIRSFLYTIPSVSKSDTVQKVANIIAHYRTRSVPVFQGNKLLGMVTAKRILQLLSKKENKWIKANQILTNNPITINSTDSLSTARKLMISKKIDHLPVIEKDRVNQVITSFHILQSINPQEKLGRYSRGMKKVGKLQSKIGNMGSSRIPQCSPNDDLNFVINSMLSTNTTCCLVILWDELQGIITFRDILSLLAIKFESEIPLYIVGVPEDLKNVNLITSKFSKALKRIQKVYSEIQEAKVTIKKQRTGSKNRRGGGYEVSVMITTPHYVPFFFKEAGYDLSKIFEILSQKMLRKLSKRSKRRYKTSIRKINLPISSV